MYFVDQNLPIKYAVHRLATHSHCHVYNTYYGLHYLQKLLHNTTGRDIPRRAIGGVYPRGNNIEKKKYLTLNYTTKKTHKDNTRFDT